MAFVRKESAERHVVRRGESIKSLAENAGMTWQELAKYNWGTDVPDQINQFLFLIAGCRQKTPDGHNYIFSDDDVNRGTHELNGIVFIPERFSQENMALDTEHEIRIRVPSADELRSLRIVTDLKIDEVSDDDDTFLLTSPGGEHAYRTSLSTKYDRIVVRDYIDLLFDGLHLDGRYTLEVKMANGEKVTLFEDVPYADLTQVSDGLEPGAVEPT